MKIRKRDRVTNKDNTTLFLGSGNMCWGDSGSVRRSMVAVSGDRRIGDNSGALTIGTFEFV